MAGFRFDFYVGLSRSSLLNDDLEEVSVASLTISVSNMVLALFAWI